VDTTELGGATLQSSHAGRFSVSGGRQINLKAATTESGTSYLSQTPGPCSDGDTQPLIASECAPTAARGA